MLTTINDFLSKLNDVDMDDEDAILAFMKFADELHDELKDHYFIPDSIMERQEQGKEQRLGFGAEDMMPYLIGYGLASHRNEPPSEEQIKAGFAKLDKLLELYYKNANLRQKDSYGYTLNDFASCLSFMKDECYQSDFNEKLESEDFADVRRAKSLFVELKYENEDFADVRDKNLALIYQQDAKELNKGLLELAQHYRAEAKRAESCLPLRGIPGKLIQHSRMNVEKTPLQAYVDDMNALAKECEQFAQDNPPPEPESHHDFQSQQQTFFTYRDKAETQIQDASQSAIKHARTCREKHQNKSELSWLGHNLIKGITEVLGNLAAQMPLRFMPKPDFLKKAEKEFGTVEDAPKQKSKL